MALVEVANPAAPAKSGRLKALSAALGANRALLQVGGLAFIAPNALFAARLGFVPALVLMAGCALAAAILWRAEPQGETGLLAAPIDFPTLAVCGGLALALCLLGGETHLFYANADWLARDGLLADLSRHRFPLFYEMQGRDFLLRAPLAMYLAPAEVGAWLGLHAAHVAMLAQNASLLALILYFVARLAPTRRWFVVLLMVGFSGLDIIPALLFEVARFASEGAWGHLGHIEWWNPYTQYSSHVTQLFWAPNHMLPGWWFATLMLLYVRKEIEFSAALAGFAPLLFWSPLAVLGAAPLLALLCIEQLPRVVFAPKTLIAAASGLCFLPIAYFLTRGAGDNPHRLLLAVDGYPSLYVLFLLVEIPHAVLLALLWRRVAPCDRRLLAAAIAILVALPAYEFGHSNDLGMRGSIAPLFVLAFVFSSVGAQLIAEPGRARIAFAAIAVIAAFTPGLEIARSFLHAYPISDCNFLTTFRKSVPKSNGANYLANVDAFPDWLVSREGPRLAVEDRVCWPEHPVLEPARR